MIPPGSLAIPLLAGIAALLVVSTLILYVRRRRRTGRALGDSAIVRQLVGMDLGKTPWPRLIAVALAAAAISIALLDPALETRPASTRGPVVLIMDASGSMLVDDVGPRRLDLQREIASELVALLPDLPIGIVAFAGRAFSLTPPTRDRGAVEMYLATLDPTIVTQTGSALGAAIRQGVSLLAAGENSGGGTIVLFGDGDETENVDAAREAARLARRSSVTVHVVGLGTPAGGPVPSVDLTTGEVNGFLEELDGTPRLSRIDEDLLQDLARSSRGGQYVRGSDPAAARLVADLVRGTDPGSENRGDTPQWYVWFAGAALLLLLAEPLTDESRRRSR